MTVISNPHDRFFKETFSRMESARDFVLHYLPSEVTALLDLESLEATKDSFVGKDLMERFSDMLYCVNLRQGRQAYIYLLFEHKSSPEPLIHLHLLRYMVKIWEQGLKQGKTWPLPPILPIVVYHGKPKWKVSVDSHTLFAPPDALKRYTPDFRYLLFDLSRYRDEEIKGVVILKVGLLLLKHIFSEDLGSRLPEILGLLSHLSDKDSGIEYLETILRYLASGTDRVSGDDIGKAVTGIIEGGGENIMPTLAEQWIEQGVEKGLQEGIQRGLQEGIQRGIQEGI
ncbi:MAG: Rpn family recombination-promoting nuclease/putative transposase [Deltaproteobacteria bacterium]|nr:Rpn family recombination-promoting nuclease/putative transposase [Deltaproteobacteria bacterium]